MTRPVLSFVGPGRVGWALARAARAAGYEIQGVAGGGEEARARLAAAVGAPSVPDPTTLTGEIIFLSVPDAALPDLASSIRAAGGSPLVHTAGALPAAALGIAGAGTFHPLRSFVGDPHDVALTGYGVALEADGEDLASHLRSLAHDLGMLALEIPPSARARYHAAAVLAGNAPVGLLHLARRQLTEAGVSRDDADAAVLRLLGSVVENAAERGIDEALSGPIRRGDVETVERHLRALSATDESAARAYAALGLATLDLATGLQDGPDPAVVEALRSILETGWRD